MTSTNATILADTTENSYSGTMIGFICLFTSCFSLGLMFAPLKRVDAKDGFFVQWIQCAVVFMFGFVINLVRGSPPFNPIACIGGFLFATGNIGSVPIVSEMGIGIGMLIWGSVQIIIGWCVARFGLFGTKVQSVNNNVLNYIGLALTLISGVLFVLVYNKNSNSEKQNTSTTANNQRQSKRMSASIDYGTTQTTINADLNQSNETQQQTRSDKQNLKRKLFFVGLAIFLGCFHGLMLTPIVYIQDNDPNHSDNVLDYIFAHFSSVFFFSTLYFGIYTLIRRGKAVVKPSLVLPSLVYGVLFCCGMTLWMISNHLLSQTVSFPIGVRLPAIIGALADVFVFKTIKDKRSLFYLFFAILIGALGVALVGASL